jgi:DNA-binding transcriptional LysR family regulator
MEERLRKFAHLVEAGSFTRAANELHVSQPALSTAIAKLERELKSPLLVRGSRPLTLTPAGDIAYRAAKDLAVQADNLKLRLRALAQERLSVRIGMIDSVADALFQDSASLAVLGDAKVLLVVNNSRYLIQAVARGELDIAFVAEQAKPLPAPLQASPVAAEPLVVIAHVSRRLPPGNKLPDFIGYDQPSNTFRLIQRALREYGIAPQIGFYSTSPEVMLRLALLNKGVAALPFLMVRDHLKRGALRRLGSPRLWLIPRPIIAIRRRDKNLPAVLAEFTEQAAVVLERLAAEAAI